ncbi:hypothetical protein K438DRAFT_1196746 [Mycena galopus ATCC 62051]|nr:hypothetical protein K438DRAFT_1196746 [Mycena galopus ATCC 62051]
MDNRKSAGTTYEQPDDSPFRQHCSDNAQIWKYYMDYAKTFDRNLADLLNGDLNPLLIFAALFSAILAAFLIEIRKGLQEDLQTITNGLLVALIQSQHNISGTQIPSSSNFVPATSTRWVNGLWFLSLMFSLMSALGASLAQGWVTQFASTVSASGWGDASLHCQRLGGLHRWHLKAFIQCLPILIHLAFFLFSSGLVVLLFHDDQTIGIVVLVLTAVVSAMYVGNSVVSAHYRDSPFRTPVSDIIRYLFTNSWPRDEFSASLSDEDGRKAQALSWLLARSLDADIIHEAIRAVAGLRFTLSVHDELVHGATTSIISTLLSEELSKSLPDLDLLSAYLYALLHCVQAAVQDKGSAKVLQTLVQTEGVLANTDILPLGLHEVALCLKARVLLLVVDQPSKMLFETQLPGLANSCIDPYLRRLLVEVCLLAGSGSSSELAPNNSLAVLRTSNSDNQHRVHGNLAKRATGAHNFDLQFGDYGVSSPGMAFMTGPDQHPSRWMEMVRELSSEGNMHRLILTQETVEITVSLLGDSDWNVRQEILQTIEVLVQYDDIRTTIVTHKMVQKFLQMLWDSNKDIQERILQTIMVLAQYKDIRDTILTQEIIQDIIVMLDRSDKHIRERAMQTVMILMQYSAALLCSPITALC